MRANARALEKRGGAAERVVFDESLVVSPASTAPLVELDESLRRLESLDARKGRIVELLFFGGLTYDETAAALGISPATVHRELKMAKAWLHRDLAGSAGGVE